MRNNHAAKTRHNSIHMVTRSPAMSPPMGRRWKTESRTLATCLLAWPMTSSTGDSCCSDSGNSSAIQHRAVILAAALALLRLRLPPPPLQP